MHKNLKIRAVLHHEQLVGIVVVVVDDVVVVLLLVRMLNHQRAGSGSCTSPPVAHIPAIASEFRLSVESVLKTVQQMDDVLKKRQRHQSQGGDGVTDSTKIIVQLLLDAKHFGDACESIGGCDGVLLQCEDYQSLLQCLEAGNQHINTP